MMGRKQNKSFPKPRTGRDCKKTNCKRYESYIEWSCGNPDLNFCMECKHAHVSQYEKKDEDGE